jgi:hypothetical protein
MSDAANSEHLWLTRNDLSYLSGVVSASSTLRQRRLLGCACIRRTWAQLADHRTRELVEVLEAVADYEANREQLKVAVRAAEDAIREVRIRVAKDVWFSDSVPAWVAADGDEAEVWTQSAAGGHPEVVRAEAVVQYAQLKGFGSLSVEQIASSVPWRLPYWVTGATEGENAARCALVGDIFGNPFRPVAFSPSWRTDTAVSLARQMYESREFLLMPILADALQDAGCSHPDVLDHCHDPAGAHVRGCWVVDLVLGKQ